VPQRTGSSLGLWLPSAHKDPEVHSLRGFQIPLRSAFRVWLPSWRVTPSEPVSGLFRPDSAHGIHPSERSPLERYPNVSARKHPHAVFPAGTAVAETTTRSGRPRLLGFDPSESPARPSNVFNALSRRMLPWVSALPGHTCESLGRDPSRLPLTRFANLLPEGSVGGASGYQSALAWPCPSSTASRRISVRQPS